MRLLVARSARGIREQREDSAWNDELASSALPDVRRAADVRASARCADSAVARPRGIRAGVPYVRRYARAMLILEPSKIAAFYLAAHVVCKSITRSLSPRRYRAPFVTVGQSSRPILSTVLSRVSYARALALTYVCNYVYSAYLTCNLCKLQRAQLRSLHGLMLIAVIICILSRSSGSTTS